jgi:hypothetical protein
MEICTLIDDNSMLYALQLKKHPLDTWILLIIFYMYVLYVLGWERRSLLFFCGLTMKCPSLKKLFILIDFHLLSASAILSANARVGNNLGLPALY